MDDLGRIVSLDPCTIAHKGILAKCECGRRQVQLKIKNKPMQTFNLLLQLYLHATSYILLKYHLTCSRIIEYTSVPRVCTNAPCTMLIALILLFVFRSSCYNMLRSIFRRCTTASRYTARSSWLLLLCLLPSTLGTGATLKPTCI